MAQPYPISRETREEAIYFGDGGATYGPFDLKIADVEDVEIWIRAQDAAVWSLAAPTVTKTAGDPIDTFSIAFPYNLPATSRYKVLGKRTHERSAGVTNGTRIDPNALEKELTKVGMVLQELRRDVGRGIQVQFGDGLIMSDDLEDGDTLMKSGGRVVKGANAADIAAAQEYAAQAGEALILTQAALASAEGIVDDAEAAATRAEEAAASAALGATARFETVSGLLADNLATIGYAGSGATFIVSAGSIVEAGGFRYQVAPAIVIDQHVATAGGVLLYVLPGDMGYNLVAFGGVGDGVTNNSAAIQKLFDVAKATWRPCYAPAGRYLCGSAITFETTSTDTFTPGLVLRGDGPGKTVFLHNGPASSTLFAISTNTALKFQMSGVLEGFSIEAGPTAQTGRNAISVKGLYQHTFRDVRIKGMSANGVVIISALGDQDASNNLLFEQVRIEDCGNWGVITQNATGVNENSFISLRHVFIQGCGTLDGIGGGMYWRGQALLMDQAAFVLNKNRGLYIEGGAGLGNTVFGANVVFENNIGKGLECWGIQAMTMLRTQFYANDASHAGGNTGHLCYFNGSASVVRNVQFIGVIVRATAANNPLVAFYGVGANLDAGSVRISDVTWDNYDYTGQTRYSGVTAGDRDLVIGWRSAPLNFTTTSTLVPFDNETVDVAGSYTPGTGIFIPKATRPYRVTVHVQYTALAANEGIVFELYNITDGVILQTQIFRSAGTALCDYVAVLTGVLTEKKGYGVRIQTASGTRAMSVGSANNRLTIEAI